MRPLRALALTDVSPALRVKTVVHLLWIAIEMALGLFGALYLVRAGGGLVAIGLWSLVLGPVIALAFVAALPVFPRWGTRVFFVAAVAAALATCTGFMVLGGRAAEPAVVLALGLLRAVASGLYWSANNLLEYDLIPPARRSAYFAVNAQLVMLVAVATPAIGGTLTTVFGYGALFALIGILATAALVLVLRGMPNVRTQPVGRADIGDMASRRSWRASMASTFGRGLSDLGGLSYVFPLMLLAVLGSEAAVGVFNSALHGALYVGAAASAVLVPRFGPGRSLYVAWIPVTAAHLLIAGVPDPGALAVAAVFIGLAGQWWSSSWLMMQFDITDSDPQRDARRYLYVLMRELALAAGRAVAACVLIAGAVLLGDSAVRPVYALYALALPLAALFAVPACRLAHREVLARETLAADIQEAREAA